MSELKPCPNCTRAHATGYREGYSAAVERTRDVITDMAAAQTPIYKLEAEPALRAKLEGLVKEYRRKSDHQFELMRQQTNADTMSDMRKRAQDFSTVAAKLERALGGGVMARSEMARVAEQAYAKERAVIEAARAALQPLVWATHGKPDDVPQVEEYRDALWKLFEAVQALEAVEGE